MVWESRRLCIHAPMALFLSQSADAQTVTAGQDTLKDHSGLCHWVREHPDTKHMCSVYTSVLYYESTLKSRDIPPLQVHHGGGGHCDSGSRGRG